MSTRCQKDRKTDIKTDFSAKTCTKSKIYITFSSSYYARTRLGLLQGFIFQPPFITALTGIEGGVVKTHCSVCQCDVSLHKAYFL